ncbi:hypothetical protein CHH72_05315 [Shouchella clausii]|uniref:Prepilin-type N-terminal cleavage/methylation domain-containing protein n=2 Tax=Shouchella clausii TaxID=79880 RepID=A0A268P3Z2_SHOCL|nr:hypothetical protein CHH72_05315 [Shouchella clausii]
MEKMLSSFRADDGFTFIELLLTILLLSVLLLLPIVYISENEPINEEKAAIAKLWEDLVLAQHIAMTEGKKVTVSFEEDRLVVFAEKKEHSTFRYPLVLEMETVTMSINDVVFLENGHPQRSGSWNVATSHVTARFSLQIGKGRVSYREL